MDKAIRAANIKLIHSLTRQGEESMGTKLSLVQMIAAALAAACCTSAAAAQGIGRLEIHAIPSVTVSNQQFLTGNRYGRPVIVGGELRLPRATADNFPVVILIHGSSGISAATDRWAQELNSVGVAAFILDAFTGRGIISTNTDQSQLDSIAMIHDVYAALGKLANASAHRPCTYSGDGILEGSRAGHLFEQ